MYRGPIKSHFRTKYSQSESPLFAKYVEHTNDLTLVQQLSIMITNVVSLIIINIFLVFLPRQLHTPTNLLILSLAFSDFFVGLLLVFPITLIDGCWYIGDLMCAVSQYVGYTITATSVGNMVLISVDRYVAICDPLHYSTKFTLKTVKICISLCWTCSVIYACLIQRDALEQPGRYNSCFGECIFVINYIAGIADLIFSFIAPITVIVVLYMRVFVVAVSQARAMRSHIAAVTLQGSVKVTAKKSELKAARTLGVVVVVFLICLCPYYSVALTGQDNLMNASVSLFVICLYDFNACLNPLIYALFYSWFRKSVKLIVTLKIVQQMLNCEALPQFHYPTSACIAPALTGQCLCPSTQKRDYLSHDGMLLTPTGRCLQGTTPRGVPSPWTASPQSSVSWKAPDRACGHSRGKDSSFLYLPWFL
uniref:G-protein coupled receptors family 1 profile domain-containing protein n=1 Tax=Monopterus albus TaxID=43700 RepID=A0A3Q3PY48_MONAL